MRVLPPYRTAASSASEALASEAPPPLPCSRPSWQLKNASGGKHGSLWNGAFLHGLRVLSHMAAMHAIQSPRVQNQRCVDISERSYEQPDRNAHRWPRIPLVSWMLLL